ncbi:MAG: DDE-type integrase/transposase/recombinase [Anaerolineales bacterium]|nr:DDE-type integrase/transposase/recombinase [Anaerolineales bacterium]
MARRGQTTTLEERIEIGERWEAGQTDPGIATAMNRSVWTVRKWRRAYQRKGRAGLVSRMGRPSTGALGQFPSEIRETVREMREIHSGWGPLTIRTELENDQRFSGKRLPSRPRIAAFLSQEGFTRKYERHTELPQAQAEDPQHPHEEWEMDAQGVIKVADLGSVSIININDLFSRLKVDSFPCLNTSHPSTPEYQLVLRRAFVRYGLPKRISLDHDSVFYDNACASPYPTILHLWLIALGIEVRFIEQAPPAEHSVIERMHQTVAQQAIAGQTFVDGSMLQENLSDRLDFLNLCFPSRSLGGRSPLMAYPEAQHSGRPYRLEWEAAVLDLDHVHQYLAQGRWFRQVSSQGQFSLGTHRYGVGRDFANQTLEITFDSQTGELRCLSADGSRKTRLPVRGLTKSDLVGELSPLIALPAYQLALPFSPSTWREMMFANALTGTT